MLPFKLPALFLGDAMTFQPVFKGEVKTTLLSLARFFFLWG